MLPYGSRVLVRASIVRILGTHEGDQVSFRQRPADRRSPYGRIDTVWDEWPGVAVPLAWADGAEDDDWQLEPVPNGSAVVRCRRFELEVPEAGIVIGGRHVYEYHIVEGGELDNTPTWSSNVPGRRRRLDLCEVALPPDGRRGVHKDRSRLMLAHPHDVALDTRRQRRVAAS